MSVVRIKTAASVVTAVVVIVSGVDKVKDIINSWRREYKAKKLAKEYRDDNDVPPNK